MSDCEALAREASLQLVVQKIRENRDRADAAATVQAGVQRRVARKATGTSSTRRRASPPLARGARVRRSSSPCLRRGAAGARGEARRRCAGGCPAERRPRARRGGGGGARAAGHAQAAKVQAAARGRRDRQRHRSQRSSRADAEARAAFVSRRGGDRAAALRSAPDAMRRAPVGGRRRLAARRRRRGARRRMRWRRPRARARGGGRIRARRRRRRRRAPPAGNGSNGEETTGVAGGGGRRGRGDASSRSSLVREHALISGRFLKQVLTPTSRTAVRATAPARWPSRPRVGVGAALWPHVARRRLQCIRRAARALPRSRQGVVRAHDGALRQLARVDQLHIDDNARHWYTLELSGTSDSGGAGRRRGGPRARVPGTRCSPRLPPEPAAHASRSAPSRTRVGTRRASRSMWPTEAASVPARPSSRRAWDGIDEASYEDRSCRPHPPPPPRVPGVVVWRRARAAACRHRRRAPASPTRRPRSSPRRSARLALRAAVAAVARRPRAPPTSRVAAVEAARGGGGGVDSAARWSTHRPTSAASWSCSASAWRTKARRDRRDSLARCASGGSTRRRRCATRRRTRRRDAPGYDAARAPPASRGSDAVAHAAHVAVQHRYWRKHHEPRRHLAPQHAAAPSGRRAATRRPRCRRRRRRSPGRATSRVPPPGGRSPRVADAGGCRPCWRPPRRRAPPPGKGATPRGWQRVHTRTRRRTLGRGRRTKSTKWASRGGASRRRRGGPRASWAACGDSPRAAAAAAAAHVGASPALVRRRRHAVERPRGRRAWVAGVADVAPEPGRLARSEAVDQLGAREGARVVRRGEPRAHSFRRRGVRRRRPSSPSPTRCSSRHSAEMSAFDDEMSAGASAAHFARPPYLAVAPGARRACSRACASRRVCRRRACRAGEDSLKRRAARDGRRARRQPTRRRARASSRSRGGLQVLHMKLRPPPSPRKP